MKTNILNTLVLFLSLYCCHSQNSKLVGGPCEGCEAIFERGHDDLNAVDTLPGFKELPEPLVIEGRILKQDGKTPAKDVVVYFYQTDHKGIYPSNSNSKGWERRHGYIRGWIKTNTDGTYKIFTSRPASYPNTRIPQHIHVTVKERGINEYYVEDFFFADDPFAEREGIAKRKRPRGGSGLILPKKRDGIWYAQRDIILGKHIPNYPSN